jgi:hypothetical protein
MTRSPIERTLDDVVAFLAAGLPAYVSRANEGTGGDFAPDPRKVERKAYIPDVGPWPFVMVNLDQVSAEASGNNSQRLVMTISVNVGLKGMNLDDADLQALRYMDILVDCIGENISLGGAVDLAQLESIDKATLPGDTKAFVIAQIRAESEVMTD